MCVCAFSTQFSQDERIALNLLETLSMYIILVECLTQFRTFNGNFVLEIKASD